jgi:hypothetical protein
MWTVQLEHQETSMKMIYMDLGLSAKHLEKSFSL